ncbi:copper resistance CopC family protein [Acidipila sp. EB88]|uniref:copper resistance CopC family protein n=1 Tax=Acidipila sp. EB88 TaxID=2305226 RepID=UPI00131525B0|nr:copper resistance CopC family protein [Acidipila sp. EB88]
MLQLTRAAAVLALAAAPQLALAHALLVSSTPQDGGVIHVGQLHAELKFNSRVDGARSTLSLVSPDGSTSSVQLDGQNSPSAVSGELGDLKPGAYTLRWQALASDGHITRGQIAFHVEP